MWIGSAAADLSRTAAPERGDDVFHRHPLPIVGIDETLLDHPAGVDDEGGRNRQGPTIIGLKGGDVAAGLNHGGTLLIVDPDRQVEREGIAIVEIGQNWKKRFGVRLQFRGEMLHLRRDRYDLSSELVARPTKFGEGIGIEASIGAAGTAMEGNHQGSLRQKLLEADEFSILIRQQERRHRLAGRRCRQTGAARLKPADHALDNFGEIGAQRPHILGKKLEALGKRRISITASTGGSLQDLGEGFVCHHGSAVGSKALILACS